MSDLKRGNPASALVVLVLLVPTPSVGVLAAMVWWPESALGSAIFAACKLWLLLLPVLWHVFIDRQRISLSPPRKGGFLFGISSGLSISVVIVIAYLLLGNRLIDMELFRARMAQIGLDQVERYWWGAFYWITVNSILEEYVWRWFVLTKTEELCPKPVAILLSALLFTLHHVIALSVYLNGTAVCLCSLGVFVGGVVWSYTYIQYRSIWPGYLSHAIVDLCIFLIGGRLLFG